MVGKPALVAPMACGHKVAVVIRLRACALTYEGSPLHSPQLNANNVTKPVHFSGENQTADVYARSCNVGGTLSGKATPKKAAS